MTSPRDPSSADRPAAGLAGRVPDLGGMELLVAVARLGSLGRAARELGISQPAASGRMRALERQLGVALVRRSPGGSRLTDSGALVTEWARKVLEAAEVDGANRVQSFWYITVPLLRPTIFLVVALGTIGAFQMFDQAKFMTAGGPLNSTLTPMLEIYDAAFNDSRFGSAAAMSVILFLIIFVVTMLQRRFIDTGTNSRQ